MLEKEYKSLKPNFDKLIERYHSGEIPLSYSSISSFIKGGPRGFFENRMLKKETDSMNEGKALHCIVLEPEKFEERYYVFDDSEKIIEIGGSKPRATKEYRQWKEKVLELNNGKIELSISQYDFIKSLSDYLKINEVSKPIIERINETEKKIYFEFEGYKFIVYVDIISDMFTADLKKCVNADVQKVKWLAKDMCYDIQGAVTYLGTGIAKHNILMIDNNHQVSIVEMDGKSLNNSVDKLSFYVNKFNECIEQDDWNQGTNYFNDNIVRL